MVDKIVVGCPYCLWVGWSDRRKLDRDRVIACERCRSLVSSATAETVGKEIERRLRNATPVESVSAFIVK